MNRNFMKMNDVKTEYTKFGNKRQLLKCTGNDIQNNNWRSTNCCVNGIYDSSSYLSLPI